MGEEGSFAFSGFLTTMTYILLLNTLIPISLIISLELVRTLQALNMENDAEVRWKEETSDVLVPLKCISSHICEELGKVEYVFTDKVRTCEVLAS